MQAVNLNPTWIEEIPVFGLMVETLNHHTHKSFIIAVLEISGRSQIHCVIVCIVYLVQ